MVTSVAFFCVRDSACQVQTVLTIWNQSLVEKLSSFVKSVSPFSRASNIAREFWHLQSDAVHDSHKLTTTSLLWVYTSLMPTISPKWVWARD